MQSETYCNICTPSLKQLLKYWEGALHLIVYVKYIISLDIYKKNILKGLLDESK